MIKLRSISWSLGLEFIFGVLLPTIFFGPYIYHLFIDLTRGFLNVDGLISLGGLFGILSLWLVVLLGPNQINAYSFLRWFVITAGISGLAVDLQMVFVIGILPWKNFDPSSVPLRWVLFGDGRFILSLLIAPILVGLKYLPQLLRGTYK